ncbi:hypothetical protein A2642_04490 [Candidatus Nomurabacteria bacterium RIFCSPHIGHO2_01_FULL_39_10]|uniref:Lipoprotein n=1 Tax=Candidatus Nomurabacteria bacterium RIFCSPHIGHO2_01_FULL_39_10 TaxID=1801733 RepID=A0A1F6V7D2_9BACT|nr:MAG: hypothetical protein A2642_04490 [Candidatus Nomurabacteria bacterium RIFCSPHIGHO2_01_FULL_39_10]
MNKLYTGLIGLVLAASCGKEVGYNHNNAVVCPQYDSQISQCPSPPPCPTEKSIPPQGVKQAVMLPSYNSSLNGQAGVQEEPIAVVKSLQEENEQRPKMDQPIHPLLKGIAQGRYDFLQKPHPFESLSLSKKLYRKEDTNESYALSTTEDCAKNSFPVDIPAEYTPCTVRYALEYNSTLKTFQLEQWRASYFNDRKESRFHSIGMGAMYQGEGQTLTWDKVTKVFVRTPNTQYNSVELRPDSLSGVGLKQHQHNVERILSFLLQHAEQALTRVQDITSPLPKARELKRGK